MSVPIVARRYARAVLEIGLEIGQLDGIVEEVTAFAAAWEASPEFRNAIENPLVAHSAKKAVVNDLAERLGASPTTRHTVLLLVDRRRARALPYLAKTLRELADARKGLLRAEVTTAAALSDTYYARLEAQLEKMTGKRVVVERRTDPTLIAGVVTRIGDRILDGSLRTRLQSLRDALMPAAG
ncbi:MAG TPA: ATP synthase F1 subunit delta [Elusimicrobiota bacterium]|jgi:F-type H+-transporting ATPase subunit delta|nr:ATP synthase F1 subunit delta [Elusimicrobiota bacterium]